MKKSERFLNDTQVICFFFRHGMVNVRFVLILLVIISIISLVSGFMVGQKLPLVCCDIEKERSINHE